MNAEPPNPEEVALRAALEALRDAADNALSLIGERSPDAPDAEAELARARIAEALDRAGVELCEHPGFMLAGNALMDAAECVVRGRSTFAI